MKTDWNKQWELRRREWLRLTGLGLGGLSLASLPSLAKEKRAPRTVFNDDGQVLWEAPAQGTVKFITDWLDREAAAVPFSTFVFQAALPDVCVYQTKVGEVYGERLGPEFNRAYARTLRVLKAKGTDPLHVVTSHMKAKGKETLAAVRMSDTHHSSLDPKNPLCPQFAIDHPEYVIQQPDGRTNETALDYSHPEVRAHRLAIMKEIAGNYNVDGLELNFVRWAKHFPRDKGREKAQVMTAFMGEIHAMLKSAANKRGRKRLTLGVRVPESLATCWLAGCDVKTWVERGWIDYVVISTWNNTDPQLRVEEFAAFTKPAGVDTIVVMGNMMGCIDTGPPLILDRPTAMSAKHAKNYQGMLLTASEARAAAANYYTWGADTISFWNVGIHFGRLKTSAPAQRARIARWTKAVQSRAAAFKGPRTYRYLPMGKGISSRKPPVRNYPWYDEGRSPLGHVNSPVLRLTKGKRRVFPFRMADGRDGGKLKGRLTFWVYHLRATDKLVVDINGKPLPPERLRRFPVGKRRGGLLGQRVEIPLAHCPPFRGDNELGLKINTPVNGKFTPYMEELEVAVLP